ncbi:MAG: MJ1477/TM1410 family putative glycoside hydrolase [Bacteroidota bacterium]
MKYLFSPIIGLLFIFLLFLPQIHAQSTSLMDVNSWAYQLQNININQVVSDTSFELIVMDYSQDGTDDFKFTSQQITQIKNSGEKAIAYISIGEAEDYRYYWQSSWETTPPSWLGDENPDWHGNYKVRFWNTAWQNIIFSYIDTIISQGFDGIYMDIIDAYYYWQFENSEEPMADSLMVQFVLNIRNHIDGLTLDTFYIIPQNGEFVTEEGNVSASFKAVFFNTINGIGVEDVFFEGNFDEDNPYNPDNDRILLLQEYLSNGKQVFSIEYLTQSSKIQQYLNEAATQQFVPYVCVRDLDQLCSGIATRVEGNLIMQKSGFSIYPNPASLFAAITFEQPLQKDLYVNVYSILGKPVKEIGSNFKKRSTPNSFLLNLSDLQDGIYLLEIFRSTPDIKIRRLLIKKEE